MVEPAHFEAAFEYKPRARVMVYRDWLVKLSPVCVEYISEICRSQRGRMNEQMVELYSLAQSLGTVDFVSALELAAEQHLVGAIASTNQLQVPLNLSAGVISLRSSLASASASMSKVAAQTVKNLNNTLPQQLPWEMFLERYQLKMRLNEI